MRKSSVSRNVGSWGDFLFIIGILGIVFGLFVTAMDMAPGLFIIGGSFLSVLSGVLFRGISIIAEASERYLQKLREEEWKEASKGPDVDG